MECFVAALLNELFGMTDAKFVEVEPILVVEMLRILDSEPMILDRSVPRPVVLGMFDSTLEALDTTKAELVFDTALLDIDPGKFAIEVLVLVLALVEVASCTSIQTHMRFKLVGLGTIDIEAMGRK